MPCDKFLLHHVSQFKCRNPSLGFTTKARVYKGASQNWTRESHFMLPGMQKECEGMNPHTPKWLPILGVEVLMDSRILKGDYRGQNSLD